jgi:hypothetical protein
MAEDLRDAIVTNNRVLVVRKNRRRAFWSLVIIIFFIPISAWLVYLGLQPGRPDVSWSMVLFGALGIVTFSGSAVMIVRTMRAPWRLELQPERLALYTPTYDLEVPWDDIAAIAVDEVNRRLGCILVFEDVAAVAQRARFHHKSGRPDAINSAKTMQARMEDNFEQLGYHLAIPARILELGPEELAQLLVKGRTGAVWSE